MNAMKLPSVTLWVMVTRYLHELMAGDQMTFVRWPAALILGNYATSTTMQSEMKGGRDAD
jgi:hypothetical protein